MNAILLVIQLLQAAPELYHAPNARPFADVPSDAIVATLHDFDERDERALAQDQLDEKFALEFELAQRTYEARK